MEIVESDFVQMVAKVNQSLTGYDNSDRLDSVRGAISSYYYYDEDRMQIVSIVRSLIKNHYFVDGNKRTAATVLFALSSVSGIPMTKNDDYYIDVICDIASNHYSVDKVAEILFE